MSNPHLDVQYAAKLQEKFERYLDKRGAQLEARIRFLANLLPFDKVRAVQFGGDPRGAVVMLKRPQDRLGVEYSSEGVAVD